MTDMWLGAATLHEAMGRRGVIPTHIKPVDPDFRASGAAFPVLCREGSNLAVHQALYLAAPGDVLVVHVEASGTEEFGYFGEIMAEAAKARGLAGLVIDGAVRDAAQLSEIGFPVFAAGLSIRGTTKDPHPNPLVDEIDFGSCVVRRSDLVVGDRDGLVCVPAAEVADVLAAGRAREDKEADHIRRLRAGERTLDLMGLPEFIPA
ncbi:RraA family protein [Nocardia jiangxiensis]|uniref:Putative 4-hydroxy-4-methyl-2-oxoglutarate aldolase n=1 Tax=Nocardia jiangxiensis TaxID=282685 RepID=A0ABW6SF07_9NOCA